MAVIGIFTEPTGRTRVLFDFSAPTAEDDEKRIALAMAQSRPAVAVQESEIRLNDAELRRAKRIVPAFR